MLAAQLLGGFLQVIEITGLPVACSAFYKSGAKVHLICTVFYRTLFKARRQGMAPHAAMEKESKKERLEARLTQEQKKHIEHAARIKGTSVSDFVVLSAEDAAVRTIREQEVLTLNERARELFANALLNPPAPGARLVTAARRYREQAKV